MTAQELIQSVVFKGRQPFAHVVVCHERAQRWYKLKPEDQVPDESDGSVTVFIRVDGVA